MHIQAACAWASLYTQQGIISPGLSRHFNGGWQQLVTSRLTTKHVCSTWGCIAVLWFSQVVTLDSSPMASADEAAVQNLPCRMAAARLHEESRELLDNLSCAG